MAKEKQVRKCKVPGCPYYRKGKWSMFSPTTEEMAEKWSSILNCNLKKGQSSRICEKHFDPKDIHGAFFPQSVDRDKQFHVSQLQKTYAFLKTGMWSELFFYNAVKIVIFGFLPS